MKRKILIALSILSLASSQAFAIEITDGKLISHKESTTGAPNKVSFKELKATKYELSKLKNKFSNHYVYAAAKASEMRWDESIGYMFAAGEQRYHITNFTDSHQTYKIEKSLCIYKASGADVKAVETCHISDDEIELAPNGSFSENIMTDLYGHIIKDSDPGVFYEASVALRINNETSGISFDSSDSKPL